MTKTTKMKKNDKVKFVGDLNQYSSDEIKKGEIGTIEDLYVNHLLEEMAVVNFQSKARYMHIYCIDLKIVQE